MKVASGVPRLGDMPRVRLVVVSSHPIQYQGSLFRELARRVDLEVLYCHRATPADQARAGFGVEFEWDVDILSGYKYSFLDNVSRTPGTDRFDGCDTPEVGARLRRGEYDCLMVTGWHLKAFLQAIVAARWLGMPVLVRGDSQLFTPRGLTKKALKLVVYPVALRAFHAALYVGERSRAYYVHYGYPAHRLFFSPHCVDTGWFEAQSSGGAGKSLRGHLRIDEQERVVLFAGKLVEFKRPLDVVAAVGRLRAMGLRARLMIAGSGPLKEAVRCEAARLEVPLDLLGFCNQSQMPAVYAAADVLGLPSNGSETWGLVANEALACGTPVVLSDAAGCAPDLAGDGTVGRVFAMGDINDLTEALHGVLTERPSAMAVKVKSASYSISAAVGGIEEALVQVCKSRVS